jgi:glycerol kinase
VLGVPVVLGELAEMTALGAAYLAGVGAGLWTVSDLRGEHARLGGRERSEVGERRYEPSMSEDESGALLAGWADALARARGAP